MPDRKAPSTIPVQDDYAPLVAQWTELMPGGDRYLVELRKHYSPLADEDDLADALVSFGVPEVNKEESQPSKPQRLPTSPSRLRLSPMSVASLQESLLVGFIRRADLDSATRATALEELIARGASETQEVVLAELGLDQLRPSWRNALLLAAEHVEFSIAANATAIRPLLLKWALALAEDHHPRAMLAQEAAVRRFGALIDEPGQAIGLREFLQTKYSIRIRQIGLQCLQNLFAASPPLPHAREQLAPLVSDVADMTRFFLRKSCLESSEDEFTLGVNAFYAMCVFPDRDVLDLAERIRQLRESWLSELVADHVECLLTRWRLARAESGLLGILGQAIATIRGTQSAP